MNFEKGRHYDHRDYGTGKVTAVLEELNIVKILFQGEAKPRVFSLTTEDLTLSDYTAPLTKRQLNVPGPTYLSQYMSFVEALKKDEAVTFIMFFTTVSKFEALRAKYREVTKGADIQSTDSGIILEPDINGHGNPSMWASSGRIIYRRLPEGVKAPDNVRCEDVSGAGLRYILCDTEFVWALIAHEGFRIGRNHGVSHDEE